jgi:geranylgeranyl pyrophosphate synthase
MFESYLKYYQDQFKDQVYQKCEDLLAMRPSVCDRERKLTLNLINRGGKRIRSAILAYVSELVNSENQLKLEALIEIFHVALLIHDDIVDQSECRRGGPCFHVELKDSHRAMIWGDYLFSMIAVEFEKIFPDPQTNCFPVVFRATCEGQLLDIQHRGLGSQPPSEEELLEAYAKKTGVYGFYFPIKSALILNQIPHADMALWNLCSQVGRVYQISDDLCLLLEDQDQKSAQSDFELRQHTYLTLKLEPLSSMRDHASFKSWRFSVITHKDLPSILSTIQCHIEKMASQIQPQIVELPQTYTSKLNDVVNFSTRHALSRIGSIKI